MKDLLLPIAVVSALGLLFGVLLSFVQKKLAVPEDERVAKIREALPGANCGGCGFASCDSYAQAVVQDGAAVNICRVGGEKAAEKIAAVMGVDAGEQRRLRAYVRCRGCAESPQDLLDYRGIQSCKAVSAFYGGRLNCTYGCTGYGDCVAACSFNAISVQNAVAVVDPSRCTGCLACVEACPKGIIEPIEATPGYMVACRNREQGKYTRVECSHGCIGCKKCEKNCPSGAVTVDGFLARIDRQKCTLCGKCAQDCPVGCIQFC